NGPAPMDYPFKLTGYLKATHQFSAIELGSLVATSKTATDITCFEKMWTLSPFISLNCDQSSSVFSLCIQTGLEEDQGNKKIQFYPNPFTDRLTIEYEGQEKLEMKLFSLTGEFIKSLCVGENELKELSSGVYIITSPFFVRKITKFGGFCCENV
ncbi:MAG TPA: T9SS type A sorting domain-containing protein, partial [Candidatus Absconditabacterales bacterium]|nr:T9SS type A sorting domain-containing protein [Candidatus Absconditabacterales bacterium]